MPRSTLYVAVTNHGFGHATRAASIAAAVKAMQPEVDLVVATTAPQWLLNEYLPVEYEYRPVAFDIGVIQPDSLRMDLPATLAKLQDIQAHQEETIAAEAAYLKQRGVSLVLADIPPLATAIAHAANIPCWMVSNFGWDFIYRGFGPEFTAIADWIGDCFSQCDRLFRLPFHEPMAAFPVVEDVGLTGGTPRYEPDDLRHQWHLQIPQARTVLLTFGGLGLQTIPYHHLAQFPDWQFLTFDSDAPELANLFKVPRQGFRPVDVMPLCSRVVSKPGFSTFSEACRLDLPIVTITRNDFAEGPVLVNGMQDHSWHRVLTSDEFFHSEWEFLSQPLHPPRTTAAIAKHGNQQIASAIVDYLANVF
ncbi:glycosyl transferase [Nodosilinea sp. LEGE 07298]|uniref:glycosyl transferase n=1 Tax=Nodosilinea sp. LEGE 07298 TaxID=2777970 RepID=UPI00188234AE|nr:glycosyl transferase [Nodosilinea sp. LEGE 07298]MBE9113300.1 glycosyl transferase [Nodosilinea sp. LEGE 07298]